MNEKLENFEQAFTPPVGSCSVTCECGRVFYNPSGSWDFYEGELESLKNNPKATPVEWSCGYVFFEGHEYAMDCNCWHERAKKLMDWIDAHADRIAKYLTLEKKRKQAIADAAPVVEESK